MKFQQATILLGFALSMLITACLPTPTSTPTPAPTLTPTEVNPCLEARITAPEGANVRSSAAAYTVSSPVVISWEPSRGCPMTVSYFQNNVEIDKIFNVLSGASIDIGLPGSGETEIKIWVQGTDPEVDNAWVWVDGATPTP